LEAGGWKFDVRNSKLETRVRRLEVRGLKHVAYGLKPEAQLKAKASKLEAHSYYCPVNFYFL
jgi:hypothetical protein